MGRAGRPLPHTKTLGTAYNLRPDTEPVPASAIRVGDVVMEGPDHPVLVTATRHGSKGWRIEGRYVWQEPSEPTWLMGFFAKFHPIQRAKRGEY